jgi:chaperonin cofactor prefoldin
MHVKLYEQAKHINDFNQNKSRLAGENSELSRQLEDVEHQVSALSKAKTQLQNQLGEAQRALEEETRGKGSVSK